MLTFSKIDEALTGGHQVKAVFMPENHYEMAIYEDRHSWPPQYPVEIVNLDKDTKEGSKIANIADDLRCDIRWVENSEVRGLLVLTEYVQDAIKVFQKALRVLGATDCKIMEEKNVRG